MNYTLAHLSDFHFAFLDDDFARGCALVDDAIAHGADHLVVTGDIADAAQMEVVRGFIRHLKGRAWAGPERLTVIPGNHDIFPISLRSRPSLRRPNLLFQKFNQATSGCRKGAASLVAGETYPFGKVLSPDVVIVGMDTTRNEQFNPLKWAEGELQENHRAAVTDFFARHSQARHRIVAMHHHPWVENLEDSDWVEQNFTTPPPEEVEAWLRTCGATLVLCGHVHQAESIEIRKLGRRCRVLRSGTAGGVDDEAADGDKLRVYHLVVLGANGRKKIVRRDFRDGEYGGQNHQLNPPTSCQLQAPPATCSPP